jgi:hypothetical protein
MYIMLCYASLIVVLNVVMLGVVAPSASHKHASLLFCGVSYRRSAALVSGGESWNFSLPFFCVFQ